MNKISHVCLDMVKIALLCGASLQFVQAAHAGWNKEISELEEVDYEKLSQLKFKAAKKEQEFNKEIFGAAKDVKKDFKALEDCKKKAAKWEQRKLNTLHLMRERTTDLARVKHFLHDKVEYLVEYPDYLAQHQSPETLVKVEDSEVKAEDLRAVISYWEQADDVDPREKSRQLSSLKAQLAKLENGNLPSEEEEEIAPINTSATPPSTNIRKEIEELTSLLEILSPVDDRREISQIQAKLVKLNNADRDGVVEYMDESELIRHLLPSNFDQE